MVRPIDITCTKPQKEEQKLRNKQNLLKGSAYCHHLHKATEGRTKTTTKK